MNEVLSSLGLYTTPRGCYRYYDVAGHPLRPEIVYFCHLRDRFMALRAEDDKVAAFTEWLCNTPQGNRQLRRGWYGRNCIADGDHVPTSPPDPAIEKWIHLDEVRKAKGISVCQFREIFAGTRWERLFNPEHKFYEAAMEATQQYRCKCVEIRQHRSFPHDYQHGGPEQFTSWYGKYTEVSRPQPLISLSSFSICDSLGHAKVSPGTFTDSYLDARYT